MRKKMVTYHVGTQGLEVRLDASLILSDKRFYNEELPPNVNWETVTVADEVAMDKWIAAKNKYLEAAWTPNQMMKGKRMDKSCKR